MLGVWANFFAVVAGGLLGTLLRGVTVSSLYHIINERRNANRATVITTNLDSDLLYEKYDDRIAARLTDPSRMKVIPFVGTDVRRFAAQK